MSKALPFEIWLVIGDTGELVGTSINLPIAHAAYEKAIDLYPIDLVELRHGERIIAKSQRD